MELKDKIMKLLVLLVVLIPLKVCAASVSVVLECPASTTANSEVTCTVSVTPNGSNLAGIQFNYSFTNATYRSFTVNNSWSTYSNSENGVSLGINPTTGTTNVGTLKVYIGSSSATIGLTNIQGTDDSYDTLNGNDISKTINLKSSNNNLSYLSIEGVSLSPTFNASTINYTASTEKSNIRIKAIAEDSKAKINGTGTFDSTYGKNTFSIDVTSETGSKKTYTIVVTRVDTRSNNNNLKSLALDKGTINFNKNTTTYNVSVEGNVSAVVLSAEVEDNKASFVNEFGPRTVNLGYGSNRIEVKVKAENESVKTYIINVTKQDNRSSNTKLKDLKVEGSIINFDSNQYTYNISVKNDVTKLNIEAIPVDDKAVVTIDNKELQEGLNIITITVKAENESTIAYTINVTRLQNTEGQSDNNDLKTLKIKNYDIAFDPDKTSYNLVIKEENQLQFDIELDDEKAEYTIEGNHDLADGSRVRIVVKSESGLTKEYVINIVKEEKESTNIFPYVAFLLFSIVVLVFSIIRAKKKED